MEEKRCPRCKERLSVSCGEGPMVQFLCGSYYYKDNPKYFYDAKKCLKNQVKILREKVKSISKSKNVSCIDCMDECGV